ncbi:MAG TPA: flagellar hook-basal body complex protein FliE [Acetobacteraceae bacterium]|nr:flagellar hook-basal body complex protein FliE [Acetobacteraceae bacterium]
MSALPSSIPTVVVTPSAAADAYAKVGRGESDPIGSSFGATLERAVAGAIQTGHEADGQSMQAIAGAGNITQVVTALTHAELVMQTATAVRDRVVQAYQDIMKMPI